jgi:ubiquinone/menaquinone biosynthesis C-methylase UbiE
MASPDSNSGFVDPTNVTAQLPLEPGERVADFGCGAGYFSCAFAAAVGMNGHVVALDILPASLEAVMSRAKSMNLPNITPKRANLEREGGSGLDPNSMDWVIIKDMLFQNEDKQTILYEAARVLKAQGKAFVMEWSPENTMVGPSGNLRIDRTKLKELLESVGLEVVDTLSVGEYHFAYLAEKKAW